MFEQVAIHWAIEMCGAGCLSCLIYGCHDLAHKHEGIVGYIVYNKWVRRCAFLVATIMSSYITVMLVG